LDGEALNGERRSVDAAEFEIQLRPLLARLHRTAFLMLGDWHIAEDVVQVACVQVFRRLDELRSEAALAGYLRKAVIRGCYNSRRHPYVQREVVRDHVPDAGDSPADSELADKVWEAIERLPTRQRAAIVLCYYEGLTEKEVATAMRCRRGTVKQHLHRAKKQLALVLDPVWPTGEREGGVNAAT
jgi:RNA polymerase sigma factor (sigma-70 family)